MERLTDLLAASRRRALVVGALVVAAGLGVVLLAASVGDLRHANLPGHPWPPPGTYRNPFDPANPDDLLRSAEAERVKADLLSDGQIELDAFAKGDGTRLDQADTGNSLARLRQLLGANNAAGVVERQDVHLDAIVVGRLADPARPSLVTWCVEERGSGTVTRLLKATGQPVQTQHITLADRFWLVRVGDKYLITDVEVR